MKAWEGRRGQGCRGAAGGGGGGGSRRRRVIKITDFVFFKKD